MSSSRWAKLRLTRSVVSQSHNRLYLAEAAEAVIITAAGLAHPVETGGILLGVKVGREFWATSAVEMNVGARSRTSFWVPGGTTRVLVDAASAEDKRVGYVGEWHSHPAPQGPSMQDAGTMRRLSFITRRRVVLLLAMRAGQDYLLEASWWSPLTPRELVVVRTGPLAAADSQEGQGMGRGDTPRRPS